MKATNRQKKLLHFFKVHHSSVITAGAAGWEIERILKDETNRERWRRYLYITRDFDADSSELREFREEELANVQIPPDWHASAEMQRFREEIVVREMAAGSPFDQPQPDLEFRGRSFMFTGGFSFGTRRQCQDAVLKLGGNSPSQKSVSREIDYLVVGTEGSDRWKQGSYGNKLEAAILSRREHGTPAIVSEQHWVAQLQKARVVAS